jgi:hypothetical protein
METYYVWGGFVYQGTTGKQAEATTFTVKVTGRYSSPCILLSTRLTGYSLVEAQRGPPKGLLASVSWVLCEL